jgi:hypothetical protein
MNVYLKAFFRDPTNGISLVLSLVFLVAGFLEIFFAHHPLSEVVFLRYSVVSGVTMTGTWGQLYFLPLIAFGFYILNTMLAVRLYRVHVMESRLLCIVHGLVAIGTWWGIHCILVFNG